MDQNTGYGRKQAHRRSTSVLSKRTRGATVSFGDLQSAASREEERSHQVATCRASGSNLVGFGTSYRRDVLQSQILMSRLVQLPDPLSALPPTGSSRRT